MHMKSRKHETRGFTLITALLLLAVMSAISIGLLMMVNTEQKVGGGDAQNNLAFHNAEGAAEKMSSDLENTFRNAQAPLPSDICAVSNFPPNGPAGVTYTTYTVAPLDANGQPYCQGNALRASAWGQIASGPNTGLYAQLVPISMQTTVTQSGGQQVSMMRQAQVALIPVFQFGVFSDSDLGFYSSPNLDFAGRVHTNGDLYLGVANCCTVTFHDKLTAYGNVVRTVLPNGLAAAANNDNGQVLIPKATQGCDLPARPSCRAIAQNEGSVVGAGGKPPQSAQNNSWQNISLGVSYYNGMIKDANYGNPGGTGAVNLSLPFVTGTNFAYQIIRRPPAGESPNSPLGQSRLYNQAQIRVLLSDDPTEMLSNPNNTDGQTIRLANIGPYAYGVQTSIPAGLPGLGTGGKYVTYFATASTAMPDATQFATAGYACGGVPNNPGAILPTGGGGLDWPFAPIASTVPNTLPGNAPIITNNPTLGLTVAPPQAGTGPAATQCTNGNPPVCPANDPRPNMIPWTNVPFPINEANPAASPAQTTWNLLDGFLRVEALENGNWVGVTTEWLGLGFARGVEAPTVPGGGGAGSNPVNPDAILILQKVADRNGNDAIDAARSPFYTGNRSPYTCFVGKPPELLVDSQTTSPYFGDSYWGGVTAPYNVQSNTQFNWYPINFYDAREGEPRDTNFGNNSCTPNGVMNAVEVDVGNLKRWLLGTTGQTGTLVNFTNQNGYVVYFSDRRGMLPNPNAGNVKTGDSGLEDSINAASAPGTPDGALEPINNGKPFSPEDVNQNKVLDNFGSINEGLGFGYLAAPLYQVNNSVNRGVLRNGTPDPYLTVVGRMQQCSLASKNWVSSARHVLKLVDGSLGNVPLRPDNNQGGFTVGSENPVYIQGDYNSNANDPIWNGGADANGTAHAGVLADAVTVLSNNWADVNSLWSTPTQAQGNRPAATTYYRAAIAAGKNMSFPFPNWENANDYAFGTDGGVHNFIRFLEDWQTTGSTLNYEGSLVSLFYSTYNTGAFKCCTYSVYQPPTRNYVFDPDFTTPQGLPPGTPLFRDVDILSYRQTLTSRTY
ncbi:MAG: hypothetical protein JO266_06985 [Acidobacteria bacterium]|nr:hypothetical protein [Acidobacteriota bacterium]